MLAGACAVIAWYAAMKIVHVFDVSLEPFSKTAISMTIFAAGGFIGGRLTPSDGGVPRAAAIAFGTMLIGVALGVVFWDALEGLVFRRFGTALYENRRLFPVDIIRLWMLGWIPLLVGLVAGMFIPRSANRKPR